MSRQLSSLPESLSAFFFARALVLIVTGAGCGSTPSSAVVDGGLGIVMGAVDNHCSGVEPIVPNPASCHPGDAGSPGAADGGAEDDAGAEPPAPVLFNAEADDVDCKYHVKYTTTPVLKDHNVTFNLTVSRLADNAPASGANVILESFLADNGLHPIPNNGTKTTEMPANSGKYTMAPIKFDASGRWVVTFHFYGNCEDRLEDSPHGHVKFYYDVP